MPHRHQQVQVSLLCLGILGLHTRVCTRSRGKRRTPGPWNQNTPGALRGREPPCLPPAWPGQEAHSCTAAPGATRPGSATPARRGPGREARPGDPRRCAAGSRGKRMLGAEPRWGRGPAGTLTHRLALRRPGLRGGPRSSSRRARLLSRLNVQPGRAELGRSRCGRRACGEWSRGDGENGTVARAAAEGTTDTAAASSSQPRKLWALPPHPPLTSHTASWRSDGGTGQSEALWRPGRRTKGRTEKGGIIGRRGRRRDFL